MTQEAYLLDGRTLYAITLSGETRTVPGDWVHTSALTVRDGKIIALYRGGLMSVDPITGDYKTLSSGWKQDTSMMVGGDNTILLAHGESIYAADFDGSYSLLSSDYEGISALASLGERYFVMEDRRLQEFMPMTSGWRVIRDTWHDPVSITGLGGKVYVAQADGDIYQVDPDTAECEVISRGWPSMKGIFPVGESLMVVDGTTLYKANLDGTYEVIVQGWRDPKLWAGAAS